MDIWMSNTTKRVIEISCHISHTLVIVAGISIFNLLANSMSFMLSILLLFHLSSFSAIQSTFHAYFESAKNKNPQHTFTLLLPDFIIHSSLFSLSLLQIAYVKFHFTHSVPTTTIKIEKREKKHLKSMCEWNFWS